MRPPRRYTGFAELVEAGARERGCQVAFVHERAGRVEDVTWNDFAARVQARAAELKGDARACEAVFADGSLASIVEVFACAVTGIQVVLAAADAPEQEAAELVAAGDADAVWPSARAAGGVREALRGDDGRIERPGFGRILFFTSGTTSRAKPVALTDASLMASAYNGSALLPLCEDDCVLDVLPLSHVFGFVCGVLWGLSCGARVALGRGKRHLLDDAKTFHPTVMPLVPALLRFFLHHHLLNPELRLVLTGAAPCPAELVELARSAGLEVHCGYGLTETSSGVALSLGEDTEALTLCPECAVEVSAAGELLVSAPTCQMQGYYGRPEDTRRALEGGVLHTGDVGFIDDAGLLHVRGRGRDVVVLDSGVKLHLPSCEQRLREEFGQDDLAVVVSEGVPVLVCGAFSPTGQEGGWDVAELTRKLRGMRLSEGRDARIAHVVELGHPLPRTAGGDIQRWKIAKEVARCPRKSR
ncbi:MAG: class I adenylate-forming enzyme family protein [Coriobacteriales bacterium]